jgi:hypothetical protein
MNELFQMIIYGWSAAVVIFLTKQALAKWPIPGLTGIFAAV